jgi:NAD(P)-dependent dehydrogenase (short-subunit alcohol dehydrogenase family)
MVTGAAKRVGRRIALDFASRGWAVGVHFRNSEAAAHEVVAQIRAEGGRAAALHADLATEDQVQRLVPTATAALGPLRCLVNNASTFERDGALDATRASWDLHLESNLRAPFVLIQHFARQLEQGAEGNVINVIDERVWNLTPHFVSYTGNGVPPRPLLYHNLLIRPRYPARSCSAVRVNTPRCYRVG